VAQVTSPNCKTYASLVKQWGFFLSHYSFCVLEMLSGQLARSTQANVTAKTFE